MAGFFGYRIHFGSVEQFVPIRRWPRIFGLRITPWTVVAFFPALMVGYRPTVYSGERLWFVEPERWPTVRGLRVIPLFVAGCIGALYGAYQAVLWVWNGAGYLLVREALSMMTVFAGVIFVVVVVWGIRAFLRSSAVELFKAFLKAKKERVCPIIYIERPPEPSAD